MEVELVEELEEEEVEKTLVEAKVQIEVDNIEIMDIKVEIDIQVIFFISRKWE